MKEEHLTPAERDRREARRPDPDKGRCNRCGRPCRKTKLVAGLCPICLPQGQAA